MDALPFVSTDAKTSLYLSHRRLSIRTEYSGLSDRKYKKSLQKMQKNGILFHKVKKMAWEVHIDLKVQSFLKEYAERSSKRRVHLRVIKISRNIHKALNEMLLDRYTRLSKLSQDTELHVIPDLDDDEPMFKVGVILTSDIAYAFYIKEFQDEAERWAVRDELRGLAPMAAQKLPQLRIR